MQLDNRSKIEIFQIFYAGSQRKYLDSAFTPYSNEINSRPEWCEYWIFRNVFFDGKCNSADYTGWVSWKFTSKTRFSGHHFLNFIAQHPGYDVYFVNPFPELAATHQNVWSQGEEHHPGLISFTQNIFDKLGYQISIKSLMNLENTTLYCNYWVGNEKFWASYISFCEPIFQYIESDLTDEESRFLNRIADPAIQSSLRAFIFERLFSTLLLSDSGLKTKAYEANIMELRERVGTASEDVATSLIIQRNLESANPLVIELLNSHRRLLNEKLRGKIHSLKFMKRYLVPSLRFLKLDGLALSFYRRLRARSMNRKFGIEIKNRRLI